MSSARLECHGPVAVITLDSPPVNGLSLSLRRALLAGYERALAEPAVRAIVLTGSPRAFSAGADIREFGRPQALAAPDLREIFELLEDCPKPLVAAIDGVCMGGGLELAMSAHWRVAQADARLALPEVALGILPGGGGTQRLPRLVGLERALHMVTTGAVVQARALQSTRLLDAVVDGPALPAALALAQQVLADGRPLRRVRDLPIEHPQAEAFLQFARGVVRAAAGPFPAPLQCLEAIAAAVRGPDFDTGLRFERVTCDQLMDTPEARALRHGFLGRRAAGKVDGLPAGAPGRLPPRVGVAGAGRGAAALADALREAGCAVEAVAQAGDGVPAPRYVCVGDDLGLVELVRGAPGAAPDELAALLSLVRRLGGFAVPTLADGASIGQRLAVVLRASAPGFGDGSRAMLALVNAGAALLEAGIAARASDIDLVCVGLLGYPGHRGGPMRHADEWGLGRVLRRLRALHAAEPDGTWAPAPWLLRHAAEGRPLTQV